MDYEVVSDDPETDAVRLLKSFITDAYRREFQPADLEIPMQTFQRLQSDDGIEVTFLGANRPARFHGELGVMEISRNRFNVNRPELLKDGPGPEVAAKWDGDGHVARLHLQNWLDCIRTRNTPNAPVQVVHRTVTICHLANIACELNRPLKWNPTEEQFVGDAEANSRLHRPRREGFQLPV